MRRARKLDVTSRRRTETETQSWPPAGRKHALGKRPRRPRPPPSITHQEAALDRYLLIQVGERLCAQWSHLPDHDLATEALRGLAARVALHDRHPLDDHGRCAARECRAWGWRRQQCSVRRTLAACGRGDPVQLWTNVLRRTPHDLAADPSAATPAGEPAEVTTPLHMPR